MSTLESINMEVFPLAGRFIFFYMKNKIIRLNMWLDWVDKILLVFVFSLSFYDAQRKSCFIIFYFKPEVSDLIISAGHLG